MNIRNIIANLNPYVNWKPLRQFDKSFHSQGVYELPNQVVKKVYNPQNSSHVKRFENEYMILEYLKRCRCDFVPQLLYVDEKNTTLYLSHCGTTPASMTPELEHKVDVLLHTLESKYRVMLSDNIGKIKYTYPGGFDNPRTNNITQRDGKTFLIDFGSPRWTVLPLSPPKSTDPIHDANPILPLKTIGSISSTTTTTTPTASPIV